LINRQSQAAYLSFVPICNQKTEDSNQSCAIFSAQSLAVSTHQDETDLACSTTEFELVVCRASRNSFQYVVDILKSFDTGQGHLDRVDGVCVEFEEVERLSEGSESNIREGANAQTKPHTKPHTNAEQEQSGTRPEMTALFQRRSEDERSSSHLQIAVCVKSRMFTSNLHHAVEAFSLDFELTELHRTYILGLFHFHRTPQPPNSEAIPVNTINGP